MSQQDTSLPPDLGKSLSSTLSSSFIDRDYYSYYCYYYYYSVVVVVFVVVVVVIIIVRSNENSV